MALYNSISRERYDGLVVLDRWGWLGENNLGKSNLFVSFFFSFSFFFLFFFPYLVNSNVKSTCMLILNSLRKKYLCLISREKRYLSQISPITEQPKSK